MQWQRLLNVWGIHRKTLCKALTLNQEVVSFGVFGISFGAEFRGGVSEWSVSVSRHGQF